MAYPTTKELLPIVDHNDTVQGSANPDIIHAENKLHRSVALIVQDPTQNDSFLFSVRTPEQYTLPSIADVALGEGYLHAVRKASKGLLGIIFNRIHMQGMGKIAVEDDTHRSITALFKTRHEGPLNPSSTTPPSEWHDRTWVQTNIGLFVPAAQTILRASILQ